MRIDAFLTEKYGSRTKAKEALLNGEVLLDGKIAKPSYEVDDNSRIAFIEKEIKFVSNGGYKLAKALSDFNFDVKGLTFVDLGASNGGFTDCLLQNGVKKVYAVDVGESQLDKSLYKDNVIVMDNVNARYLSKKDFPDAINGITCDVSFISLKLILPSIYNILDDKGQAFCLIKPQFECGSKNLGKNGIVKDSKVRKNVLSEIYDFALSLNFCIVNITTAPIKNNKNIEYVTLLTKNDDKSMSKEKFVNIAGKENESRNIL